MTVKSKNERNLFKDQIDKAAKGFTLAWLYNIKLQKNGVAAQPDSKVKVSIPQSEEMKVMTDLQVVYMDGDRNITIIPSQIINGKIVFSTDHFGNFGVIVKTKNGSQPFEGPQTGDYNYIAFLFVLIFLSGTGIFGIILYGNKRHV